MPATPRIPGKGVTQEAAEALGIPEGLQPQPDDTSLETGSEIPLVFGTADGLDGITQPEFLLGVEPPPEMNAGDIVDAEIVSDVTAPPVEEKPKPRARRTRKTTTAEIDKPLIDPEKEKGKKEGPKSGIPDVDEWLDFFSRIVLRTLLDWYVDYAFRGIDEDLVSERDLERLVLTKDERNEIAAPLAEYANKNKFTRKHGREIVALADSMESMIVLTRYVMRVNRIARKYRPNKPKTQRPRVTLSESGAASNGNLGQNPQDFISGANNGRFPAGYDIYNPGGS